MKKFFTLLSFLGSSMFITAGNWTESTFFDGLNKGVNQILSYNGKLYALYNEGGKVKLGISTDGQTFTSIDAPTGSAAAGWKISANGILFTAKINSATPLHNDIVTADLKQTNVSFNVLTRSVYDPNSKISVFYPSARTFGANGDIWLGTMVSHDDGATWKSISSSFEPTDIAANGDLLMVQSNGKLWSSKDTAKKWVQIIKNGTWKAPNNLIFIDSKTILVFTGDAPVITEDSAATWMSLSGNLPLGNWSGIVASNGDLYAYHTSNVYHLQSGSITWTNIGSQFALKSATGLVETTNGTFFAAVSGKLYTMNAVGIEEFNNINAKGIEVFPNPSADEFTARVNKNNVAELMLTDVTGKVVIRSAFANTFSTANVPSGIYSLRILFMDGTTAQQKVAKY